MGKLCYSLVLILLFIVSSIDASSDTPAFSVPVPQEARFITPYAPKKVECPTRSLVRAATELSKEESAYVVGRKAKADQSLKHWINRVSSEFGTNTVPTIGLTTSGGGYRSLLSGAGLIRGLDIRDGYVATSGLLQGITYQAGLSGGAWLLSSLIGNDYPTVSVLYDQLWSQSLEESLLLPSLNFTSMHYYHIKFDIISKLLRGFLPVLNDVWGRSLGYQLLMSDSGGVKETLSGVTGKRSFKYYDMPFPIMTALGIANTESSCRPDLEAIQYEFTPFEFGSWDKGVEAFTPTKFLGSSISDTKPVNGECYTGFDNLGYMLGTSSNLFNEICIDSPGKTNERLGRMLANLLAEVHQLSIRDEFAMFPNPFQGYRKSPFVAAQKEIALVDGGETDQNNPIWPFLQPAREVDVLLVNDNSADTSENFPNGKAILETYIQSKAAGLARMPQIPSVENFGTKNVTFFGCNDKSKLTIIYLPNRNHGFDSGKSTFKFSYSKDETANMIANGVQVAAQAGKEEWPMCLACAIMHKTGEKLAADCQRCLQEHCY